MKQLVRIIQNFKIVGATRTIITKVITLTFGLNFVNVIQFTW